MVHKIEKLNITDEFTTTVEITGNNNGGRVLFFAHGFGVQRDSRGMFTKIENAVKEDFLCIRFDFNEILDNGDTVVKPYSSMADTLLKVISFVESKYHISEKYLLAHSLGGVVSSLANPQDFTSIILLAPPPLPPYDGLIDYFKQREGTVINADGISTIKRSDGTKTIIGKEYLDELPVAYATGFLG